MRNPFFLLLAVVLAACSAVVSINADAAPENPYIATYVGKSVAAGKPATVPRIYRGQDKDADYQRQLEKGYDMLGYSSFEAGDISPDQLVEAASRVDADVALVYTEVAARAPASVRLAQARAAQQEGAAADVPSDGKLYSYFASYWTKLPAPILGVHVQGTAEVQSGETGLVVLAVIESSPAAAVLRKNDTLLRLGEVRLDKPENLAQAARRYAGQTVEVAFERDGQTMRQRVTLAGKP